MKTQTDIFLSAHSALEFWRTASTRDGFRPVAWDPGQAGSPTTQQLLALRQTMTARLRAPLCLLVGPDATRGPRVALAFRTHGAPLPEGSYLQVEPGIHVASPEICVVQMAQALTPGQLAALVTEMCGTYYSLPETGKLAERPGPLMTLDSLRLLLDRIPRYKGLLGTRAAINLSLERSASPMETVVGLLLSLPCRHGGFGLPKPQLNVPIVLSPQAAAMSEASRHDIDFFWSHHYFGAEYDGRDPHTREHAFDADRRRSNALLAMGITELRLTAEHVRSDAEMEAQARFIARNIGFRMQARRFDLATRRLSLREELLMATEGSARPRWPGLRPNAPNLMSALTADARRRANK